MGGLHVVLAVLAGGAFAAISAAGPTLRRALQGAQRQFVALVTAAALVVGNVVCALPGAPEWYSALLLIATGTAFGWFAVTLLQVNRGASRRPIGQSAPVIGRIMPSVPDTQPLATVHQLPHCPADVPSMVTAQDIHDAGPLGSRSASSPTVYVATNLDAYLPQDGQRHGRRAAHARHRDPAATLRRLRVAQAYNHTPARESRVRHTL